MPLIKKITNKKIRKRKSSVKNKAKKQAKQNVTSSNDEINESEGRGSAPLAEREGRIPLLSIISVFQSFN